MHPVTGDYALDSDDLAHTEKGAVVVTDSFPMIVRCGQFYSPFF